MEANLQSGDVIVEMDGHPVQTAAHYRDVLMNHVEGEEIRIVVERPGAEGYSRLSCTAVVGIRK